MEIGLDATFLAQDRRGMGRYVRNLVRALVGLGAPHRLVLLSDSRRLPGVQAVAREIVADLPVAAFSDRTARRLDACFFPWSRLDWLLPCPRVVAIHDTAPFVAPYPGWTRLLDNHRDRERLRRAARHATLILTPSQSSRSQMEHHLGVEPDRIRVVPLGVEAAFRPLDLSSEDRRKIRERLAGGQSYLLFVGSREPRKNLDCLERAFRLLRSRRGGKLALVLAPGPAAPDAPKGEVFSAGELKEGALVEAYNAAEVFVFPSLHEGFGLPVLEAMACGVPAVLARSSSLPEVGGDAAAYFDPRDPEDLAATLGRVLDDQDFASRLREEGLARARQFPWEACARGTLRALEEAAALSKDQKGVQR